MVKNCQIQNTEKFVKIRRFLSAWLFINCDFTRKIPKIQNTEKFVKIRVSLVLGCLPIVISREKMSNSKH